MKIKPQITKSYLLYMGYRVAALVFMTTAIYVGIFAATPDLWLALGLFAGGAACSAGHICIKPVPPLARCLDDAGSVESFAVQMALIAAPCLVAIAVISPDSARDEVTAVSAACALFFLALGRYLQRCKKR